MNRKKFIWLIFMMLFSIVGIIWVQIIWIKNAAGVLNENFNNRVIAGIHDAAGAIESSRKMNFFNDFMFQGNNTFNNNRADISGYFNMDAFSSGDGNNFSIRITNQSITQTPGNKPVIVTHDTILISDSSGLIMTSPNDPGKMVIIRDGDGSTDNTGGVYIRQNDFVEWVKKRQDEFRNMSDQMISEVYQWEKTLELDNKEIENMLRRSLLYAGIQTPFEFAVIKNGAVTEGTFKKTGKNDFLKSSYMVRLFPDNLIRQDLILSVVFPDRTNYVLGSMTWILGGSMLFSLIILATFAMSLFFLIRQKKVTEMKSDFINNMTHEFKTPIATISLAADTITNPKVISDESRVRHFISMIKKENSRMNKKVETILQIASLDKKEIDFEFTDVSLHSVIERAVDTIEILVNERNGTIKLNLNASEPVIYGDGEHLVNLVNNLLDNAIKYSPEAPDITVETKNNENGIILTVTDRGIGMSKSVQNRIFDRFYRQTTGNVQDVKGFGLGLNYVRAIVDAHKGTIRVYSEQGKGSRFEVFLPFKTENEK
ncbi:MAG: HAMP domain-containing histidine kinase [Bacteroidales bacterium]|jgi:two-component system phosphate regulon sensor histidine kinase PhoR|nr:HAMP domain-containing histidine kinase [Bacteroidales bacterium]